MRKDTVSKHGKICAVDTLINNITITTESQLEQYRNIISYSTFSFFVYFFESFCQFSAVRILLNINV